MNDPLGFMTPQHHAIRNFVVLELPRNHGRPLSPARIAAALRQDPGIVTRLLDDLERHLFFLVRDHQGNVSWAFPVSSDRTPHRLRFSTGERIFCRLRWRIPSLRPSCNRASEESAWKWKSKTSCAHCGRALHILVDEQLHWRVREAQGEPACLSASHGLGILSRPGNIINDY